MSEDKKDMNGLGEADKVVDMGDLQGNPNKHRRWQIPGQGSDFDLTDEEEEMLKKKLEKLRKQDPFIYR